MVPPQDRPTFQAVSSATPNSSVLGLPDSITSIASATTAPSTQPPETEPRKLPWSSITRFEPTGRGAEPQVSTTVASATLRPSRRQSSAALRISSSRANMGTSGSKGLLNMVRAGPAGNDRVKLRHLAQPSLPLLAARAARRERAHEVGERIEIVHRAKLIDMRQHRLHALGLRLESFVAQQRVEPDQPAAGAVQPVDL